MMLKESFCRPSSCCAVAEPNDATVRQADAYGQNGRVERAIQARLVVPSTELQALPLSRFLADLAKDWRRHGKEIFPVLRKKWPQAYFQGIVNLARIIKWGVGPAGAFGRLRGHGQEALWPFTPSAGSMMPTTASVILSCKSNTSSNAPSNLSAQTCARSNGQWHKRCVTELLVSNRNRQTTLSDCSPPQRQLLRRYPVPARHLAHACSGLKAPRARSAP